MDVNWVLLFSNRYKLQIWIVLAFLDDNVEDYGIKVSLNEQEEELQEVDTLRTSVS